MSTHGPLTPATTATTATAGAETGELSQLSQLSQPSEARERPRQRAYGELGDLRPCLWCRNLTRAGYCLAAWHGELKAARDYQPPLPGNPTRCVGYLPQADDPDQRPGFERWPIYVAEDGGPNLTKPRRARRP
jgi:hypothetical protein